MKEGIECFEGKAFTGDEMDIGLSLLPYSNRESTEIINMAHSLQIHNFEIQFGNSDFLTGGLERNEIFSVHATKDLLEKDITAFCEEIQRLKAFCEAYSCKRIVFHPNPDCGKNEMYFVVLKTELSDYRICIENTCENLEGLLPLLSKYHFYITWDSAHAAYHNHYVLDKLESIEYFHIRGFSENKRYVSLVETERSDIVPIKSGTVYMLEYPYGNMYELLLDWKLLKKTLRSL